MLPDSKGQCAFEGDIIIKDTTTTSIPIYVAGAENNDLSTNNGLKAVTLHFKHQFIGDIIIELVSPSGQKVTLVGPSETISASTSLTTWNIQFFAKSLMAIPDQGYSEIWNSLQTWLGFVTYVGKYYPYMGNLEDFNMGSVNGTWTLNIIDNVLFGEGNIFCVDLIFCEEGDITKTTCSLVEHTLENEIIEACEGDSDLNITIGPELSEQYDTSVYYYDYLLFEDGNFETVLPDQNLMSYEPGSYTMCGLLYIMNEATILNDIPQGSTKSEVEIFIAENELCASLSDECLELVISPIPEIVTEEKFICQGDTVLINGVPYTETGVYNITFNQEPCDSVGILDLTVVDIEVLTNAENQSLSCTNPTTKLDGNMTDIPLGAKVNWRTDDGNIASNKDSVVIEIDRPGTYIFEVHLQGCVFSDAIVIGETEDFVYIDVNANFLTCAVDSTIIDLTSSDEIDSVSWSGPFAFSTLNEDIKVGNTGIYTVTVFTIFGCEVTRDIEVFEDKIFPNVTIIGSSLTCTNDEVTLYTTPMDELGSTFQWFDDSGNLSNDTFLVVNEPGLYSLELVTELGCSRVFEYDVVSEVEVIEAELISDTIGCNNPLVTIAYTSETDGLDVIWKLPNEDFIYDSTFTSSIPGTYSLTLTNSDGCSLDTSLVVIMDVEIPEVSILDASFFCGDDSIQLVAQTNFENLSYVWTRPDGTKNNAESPFVYSPGNYSLRVCRPNGCCATDNVVVGVDNDLPAISFDYENLSCKADTVYIVPSDTSTYLMQWQLNDVELVVDSNIIVVTEPGNYKVLVTDETNGCKSTYTFIIEEDYTDELSLLNAEQLDCIRTETQINLSASRGFESYEWSGPGLLDTNLKPFVDAPGEYIINFTLENGCSGSDTIQVIQIGEMPNLQSTNQTITCIEEEVTLSVEYTSSEISVIWTGPNNYEETGISVKVSEPGIYTAMGVASGFCMDTIEVEVLADILPPVISINNDGDITCLDSTVLVTATVDSNAESYMISGPMVNDPNDLIFEVETSGIYSIVATGFNGCESSASIEVEQNTELPSYTVNLDSLNCDDSSVAVGFESLDPNMSVIWNGPIAINDDEYSFVTDQAGNYTFTITSDNGCSVEDSFFVVMDTFPPTNKILLNSPLNCVNEEATLAVSNFNANISVVWDGPGVVDSLVSQFSTDQVGLYTLTVESMNGCVSVDQIMVEYDTLPPEIMVLGDPINCSAGKTFLMVDSDLPIMTYNWTGPNEFESENAEPLIFEEGDYHVTVTSFNGCRSIGSISVEDERVFPEIEVDDFYLPCDGSGESVFTTFLSEDAFVRWFGPNNYFTQEDTALVFEAGEYIGIAFNEEGCTTTDTFQVIDEPIYPEFDGFTELLLCFGPVPLTAVDVDDDRSISWNGPNGFYSEENPTFTEEPGFYQLFVTGQNGCVDSLTIEVVDGRIYPEAVASLNDIFQCNSIEVSLSGEGSSVGNNYSIEWTTEDGNILEGANSLNPKIDKEGTYILEIMDMNIGCSSYDTIVIQEEEQSLKGAEIEITQPTCENFGNAEIDLAVIGGFSPYTIFVDDFNYGERTNIPYLSSGEHLVSIIDSLGCQHDTLVLISDLGVLRVELPTDTSLCFGETLFLEPYISLSSDSISSIVWSSNVSCDSCRNVEVFLNQNMNISIEVTDINGCVATDEFSIKVDRPNNLPFPQIFSPNGDNINDIFYLPMTKGISEVVYLKIYDNWGGLLYSETNFPPGDDSKGWNGTVNGKNAEIGVYIVEALVTLVDGSREVYVGDVTLVR